MFAILSLDKLLIVPAAGTDRVYQGKFVET